MIAVALASLAGLSILGFAFGMRWLMDRITVASKAQQ